MTLYRHSCRCFTFLPKCFLNELKVLIRFRYEYVCKDTWMVVDKVHNGSNFTSSYIESDPLPSRNAPRPCATQAPHCHLRWNLKLKTTPLLQHHRCSTTAAAPSLQHHRQRQCWGAPPPPPPPPMGRPFQSKVQMVIVQMVRILQMTQTGSFLMLFVIWPAWCPWLWLLWCPQHCLCS